MNHEESGAQATRPPFGEAYAREVLSAAGERGAEAELLSLGENAVFALPARDDRTAGHGTVVRVGRGPRLAERAAHELRVAGWLAEHGVPVVRPAAPEVTAVEGHPLTYWERLPPAVRPPGPADVAELVGLVHRLGPAPFPLPPRELLAGVDRWLSIAGSAVPAADAAYLRERRDGFAAAVAELTPVLAPGPIHGDALPRNVHVGPDGPVLLDLETFSDDVREHDLVVMALSRDRYGLSEESYREFADVYGWDVREWEGCALLKGARETASCAWVSQHAPSNPAAAREFARRIASLRDGDTTVRWYPF